MGQTDENLSGLRTTQNDFHSTENDSWLTLRLKTSCRSQHGLSVQALRRLTPWWPAALCWFSVSCCLSTWLEGGKGGLSVGGFMVRLWDDTEELWQGAEVDMTRHTFSHSADNTEYILVCGFKSLLSFWSFLRPQIRPSGLSLSLNRRIFGINEY